jgi:hypothetical protein
MLNTLSDTWQDYEEGTSFALSEIKGFPLEAFNKQMSRYRKSEDWFTGKALEKEQQSKSSEEADLYPLRINPLVSTVMKHAHTLFGEVEDDGRPMVRPKLITSGDDGDKQLAEDAEEALFRIWFESNGRAIMQENGILSQIYGGCVFKANYVPWDKWRTIPIMVERINPKGFIGIPSASDMYRLAEAWIVKRISLIEAKQYGYDGEDPNPWWIERWRPDDYYIRINNQPIKKNGKILGGKNPNGFIPISYIPHLRIGAFLGINAIDHLYGMVKELNLRFADYGDAVNDDSHAALALRNVQGAPRNIKIGTREVTDLGSAIGITGNEPEPMMWEVTKARASKAMADLVAEIYRQYRRDAYVPAVADGEDEGSQRSGMTLAIRFWPLGSHISTERVFWTAAMDVFQMQILKMAAKQKVGKITEEHTKFRMKQKWSPILPRDRETDVQEWVQRAAADLGSIEHLLELTGDIEDIDEQRKLILKWIEDVETIKAKVAKEFAPEPSFGQPSPQGGAKKKTESKPKGGQS